MSTPLFDTLRVTKDLESCGFDSKQSEGIVAAIETSLESGVATKADVAAVSNDLSSVKAELKADIAELKSEIAQMRTETKADIQTQANKIILAVIAVVAVAVATMKLL